MLDEKSFTFRLNCRERALLEVLAKQLQRTRSDTLRYLIVNTAAGLNLKLDIIRNSKIGT